MPHMLSLNNAIPLGLQQQISITPICHRFFSQGEVNKHANGQMTFNLTRKDSTNTTQGYRANMLDVWECYSSPCTVCIAVFECGSACCFMYSTVTLCAHICLHISLGIHRWIDLLSPIILCLQTSSVPLCLSFFFLLSPSIGRLGNRRSSFEPITQPDPLIITNLPESLIRGLPNSAMCTQCGFRLSPAVCFFIFFQRWCKGGKSKEKEKERDRVRERENG